VHDHGDGHAHHHADDRAHGHGHSHAHGPGHSHAHAPERGHERVFAFGLAINAAFVALEAWAGWRAGSLALLSDAGHNLGDVLGLALAWAGAWAARRAPSARYTWGWRRAALLAALVNAVLLLIAVGAIAWEAVHRLGAPAPVDTGVVVGVAAAGIVVNGLTAWLLARGRHDDINVRGAYLHMVADAAVSAGVVVGGLLVAATGWLRLDPAGAHGRSHASPSRCRWTRCPRRSTRPRSDTTCADCPASPTCTTCTSGRWAARARRSAPTCGCPAVIPGTASCWMRATRCARVSASST
jgi:cobalt-zinc-cadmium efflux system protein